MEPIEPTVERIHFTKVSNKNKLTEALPPINKFSSWLRLIRCTARVLLFINLLRPHKATVRYKRTVKRPDSDPTWKLHKRKAGGTPTTVLHSDRSELQVIQLPGEYIKTPEAIWVKSCQQDAFLQEIEALQAHRPISKDSRLRLLAIYLDSDGTLWNRSGKRYHARTKQAGYQMVKTLIHIFT